MSKKNILLPLIGGAMAGAALALLVAPTSGKNARKKLLKKAQDAKDTLTYCFLEAEDQVGQLRDKLGKKSAAEEQADATVAS